MRLTTRSRYGLKICLVLGLDYNDKAPNYISIPEIADKCGYTPKYVEKIMRHLKKAKIVDSIKGVSGGYSLSRLPEKLSLGEIIRALENDLMFIDCVNKDCKNKSYCPTHDVWRKLYIGINDLLNEMKLQDIIEDYKVNGGILNEKADLFGSCRDHKC